MVLGQRPAGSGQVAAAVERATAQGERLVQVAVQQVAVQVAVQVAAQQVAVQVAAQVAVQQVAVQVAVQRSGQQVAVQAKGMEIQQIRKLQVRLAGNVLQNRRY